MRFSNSTISLPDKSGKVEYGFDEKLGLLKSFYEIKRFDTLGLLIHIADDVNSCEFFLSRGGVPKFGHFSAFMEALIKYPKFAKLLIDYGFDVYARLFLRSVIAYNGTDLLKLLLENGIDPNHKDDGEPILFYALKQGAISSVDILLNYKADVNIRGPGRNTPLMRAVVNSNERIVRRMLDLGADPLLENELGENSLKLASSKSKVLEILKNHIIEGT